MLHPHTELKFVSPEIGYGIYATENIPRGTITWVKDQLDRTFTKQELNTLSGANRENLLKYSYRDPKGHYFFCWDLNRFVNHSYEPNSMLTTLGFEIAIRDIRTGDEITNDYGTLNVLEPFQCANHPSHSRQYIRPDDLIHFHQEWDRLLRDAVMQIHHFHQPLKNFLTQEQSILIKKISQGEIPLPSVIENYCGDRS